jgi:4-hydroxy-3-polyprenylbenzoate decarboxylase
MWPLDGGRYIGTACASISRNPETGAINIGTYRGMIHSRNEVGVQAQQGKDMRRHIEDSWAAGEPLEVAIAYGIPPELLLVSGSKYGEAENEYEYAGGIIGEPFEVVEGEHTGLPIPAHAEIVAEGTIRPGDARTEGPFGEFTGYYGEQLDSVPVLTVEALHYRDDPILTVAAEAPYPGGDNGVKSVAMRSSRIWNVLEDIGLSKIEGVYNPPGAASGGGMTIVSIEQDHPGHVAQVAAVVSGAPVSAYFQKLVVVVDDDVDPTDIDQVLWAIATRFHPAEDLQVIEDTWGYELDPSVPPERRMEGAKVWIDATKNLAAYGDRAFPERLQLREEVYEAVEDRWDELDLGVPFPDLPSFHRDEAGPDVFEGRPGAG